MKYYPVYLKSDNAHFLIIGGGETAAQKCRLILKTTANIRIIAPKVCDELHNYEKDHKINIIKRKYRRWDIKGTQLVFACTGIAKVDNHISKICQKYNIPVNVVDVPDECTFITPGIVDRDPLTIAISSEGTAPILVRDIREHLETFLPKKLGNVATFADTYRDKVMLHIPEGKKRRQFWKFFFNSNIKDDIMNNDIPSATRKIERLIECGGEEASGFVTLVGSGPGDSGLLTLDGFKSLQTADIIFYDKLVSDDILELARRDAVRIFVGKSKKCHSKTQEEINTLLVQHAKAGENVVRLKSGDPFIFGRGGEEVQALQTHHISYKIIPGITSAIGCATMNGIPLTHRDHAANVTLLTGHRKEDGNVDQHWKGLVDIGGTLIVYMGVSTANEIQDNLIKNNLALGTPIKIIENGCRKNQRIFDATIEKLEILVRKHDIKSPALIYIGNSIKCLS